MFSVFTRVGDGEFLFVASIDQIGKAVELARELKAYGPGTVEQFRELLRRQVPTGTGERNRSEQGQLFK
jgi:hypothetical protein